MQKVILVVLIGIILLLVLGLYLVSTLNSQKVESQEAENQEVKINITKGSIIKSCEGLDLINTSNCLVNQVSLIYKYNITGDEIDLSFEELVELGGDCRDYAFLYEELGKELGFNASTVRREGINDVIPAHREAVLWDNSSYCRLNLNSKPDCRKRDI